MWKLDEIFLSKLKNKGSKTQKCGNVTKSGLIFISGNIFVRNYCPVFLHFFWIHLLIAAQLPRDVDADFLGSVIRKQ